MASSPKDCSFGFFNDLHSYKDFVGYVVGCAPELFPVDDWLPPEEQMTLDRAFVGLRYGLDLAAKEKGESSLLTRCRALVEESYAEYTAGRDHSGQLKLEEVERLIAKLPTE